MCAHVLEIKSATSPTEITSMKTLISIALVTFTAFVAGCAGSSGDNAATDDDALSSAAHPAGFVGSWKIDGANQTLFNAYTFKSDGTYSAVGGCNQSGSGPHCFAITTQSGSWKVQQSGPQLGSPAGVTEIVLTDSFHQTDAYLFTMKNDVLSFKTTMHGQVSKFDHDTSSLKKLRSSQICADKDNNTLGVCPDDLECLQLDSSSSTQRCLPPI
jgi:hypothetical protein